MNASGYKTLGLGHGVSGPKSLAKPLARFPAPGWAEPRSIAARPRFTRVEVFLLSTIVVEPRRRWRQNTQATEFAGLVRAALLNFGGRATSRADCDDGFPARWSAGPPGERIREPRDPAELAHHADVDLYERTRFSGGLNWYGNIDRD